ncbi:hypothetical protein POL68_09035 [Stigmatella sp. ncwal1]|uniref:Lipoprotein n=1 Tax=Stigmatella ashevillensis TaxID=2995309 RepID=A0ABT5D4M3_9BACT|nr:hypothetical protein [Stigmatella ashevillena]MDC0708610.1 hypothetical protein [Stigmatella ashevillena]
MLYVVAPTLAQSSVPHIAVSQVTGITDSARAKVLSHLASGEWAKAIQAYEVATGLKAPLWLTGFKAIFSASNQLAGSCQGVARSIHSTFTQLGGRPEYVKLLTSDRERFPNMIFKLDNGKDANVSLNGFHVVVRMSGRAYDAYTGASGLPWAEYLGRLGSRAPILEQVAESP